MEKNLGMIDVGAKEITKRVARARVIVQLNRELIDKIKNNTIPKGNVLEISRIAGIMAAKRTAEILPLCHNIEIECVDIEFTIGEEGLEIESSVRASAKTGVEMEALTACSAAALTIYDMCKMFSKSIEIKELFLIEKRGGKSGVYRR
ncbi:cyclic pyranopterin monophosphate synthase MoaC [Candidatus Omnitrophota bacterium]